MSQTFEVRMRGFDVVFQPIIAAPTKVPQVIRRAWFRLGQQLKTITNQDIKRAPKTGRTYIIRSKKGGKRRRHIASAPGDTHANLSGDLRRSLSWKVYGFEQLDFGYGVSTSLANKTPVYGPAIEFGRTDGLIAARPSIGNNIEEGSWDRFFLDGMRMEFRTF